MTSYLATVLLFVAFFSVASGGRNIFKFVKTCLGICDKEKSTHGSSSSRQPGNSPDNVIPAIPNRTPIALKEYKIMAKIGSGYTATVLLGQHVQTHQYYAIKVMKKREHSAEKVAREKKILEDTNFPFIVKLHDSLEDNSNVYLIMEYMCGGDLFDQLHNDPNKHWKELRARFYAAQLVLALEHLHSHNIIYVDVKLENILMDERGYIKLTDFGGSKLVSDGDSWTAHISLPYMAPEMIGSKDYGIEVDCWALGILIYEMITGDPPFGQLDRHTPAFIYHDSIKTDQVDYPRTFSSELTDLLQHLLQRDPQQRYNMKQVKKHPWFTMHIDWDQIYDKQMEAPFKPVCRQYTTPMTPDQVERAIGPISSTEDYPDLFQEFSQ